MSRPGWSLHPVNQDMRMHSNGHVTRIQHGKSVRVSDGQAPVVRYRWRYDAWRKSPEGLNGYSMLGCYESADEAYDAVEQADG